MFKYDQSTTIFVIRRLTYYIGPIGYYLMKMIIHLGEHLIPIPFRYNESLPTWYLTLINVVDFST